MQNDVSGDSAVADKGQAQHNCLMCISWWSTAAGTEGKQIHKHLKKEGCITNKYEKHTQKI